MSQALPCPHCGQYHRTTARYCPSTGKLLFPPAEPGISTPQGPPLTGRLPANSILKNRYMILKKVGQGGMAAVYQAADTQQPGVLWAIKEMSDAAITDPTDRQHAVAAFQREASLLMSLRHPNLPVVIDTFAEHGKHYLVMEFIQGSTLEEMIFTRPYPFSELEIRPWIMQLCDVLIYLHNHQPPIVFRDLKPGNIMLTPDGRVKLIDFGIVRFFKPGKARDTHALGTPGYTAPEAFTGQTDERSDIYSFCVTIHQLLTKHDPASTMFKLPPVRQLNPSVSIEMEHILQHGLQPERENRYQNIAQLQADIARISYWHTITSAGNVVVSAGGMQSYAGTPGQILPPNNSRANGLSPSLFQSRIPVSVTNTSRPTTRLLEAVTQLKPGQLVLLVSGLMLALVAASWLLAPILAKAPVMWNQVPIMGIFGTLGYAALPRKGTAFVSHALLTTALVSTVWLRLGSQGYSWGQMVIAVIVSGGAIEAWLLPLPRWKKRQTAENWRFEASWLAGMGLIGTLLFFAVFERWEILANPLTWLLSMVFGATGWFLGDLAAQILARRRMVDYVL